MSLKTTVLPDHCGLPVQELENIFKEYWKDIFKICHFYTRDDQSVADRNYMVSLGSYFNITYKSW